ncbi:hypothetical protein PG993_011740 [Apiospora rasikravindrae]|uniref:Uncharacterized protein n=1 Tax=Apiospora rasikravindrae TaxID=990691 RepID=A0ABR1S2Q9_9PEZI
MFREVRHMYHRSLVVEEQIARWERMYAESLGLEEIVGGELAAQLEVSSGDDDDDDDGRSLDSSRAARAANPSSAWF